MTTINILTRTGKREKQFNTLKNTILNQTYKNIRHIKSNDNPKCTYLLEETDVFLVHKNEKIREGFYNLYVNELAKQVTDGWVIILDDDCKLTDDNFIQNLASECSNSNPKDVLIFKSRVGTYGILPPDDDFNNKIFKLCHIDMACFCVHYTVFQEFQFDGKRCGDFYFLDKIRKSNKYNFKFINIPLGLFANYDGERLGKD